MSNEIHDKLREKVVKPELEKRLHPTIGIVRNYELETNLAEVEYTEPVSGTKEVAKKVPVTVDTQEGISGQTLKKGDYVKIAFENGRGNKPRIIRKHVKDNKKRVQDKYATKKGTYTSDVIGWL